MENKFSPLDYVSVIRRRKWWLITPIALSVVVGFLLVKYLPKEYRSLATLGVTAPTVSPSIVGQPTLFDNQERLRALSQQLKSEQILSRVVQEEKLASGKDVAKAVDSLRGNIDIKVPDPVATTNEIRRLDTFVLSVADSDPSRAQRVADRVARVFVDENSKIRTERAEDTTAFINMQVAASQERINELESRLRRAKEAYMGQLPEQAGANLATVNGLRQQLATDATQIRSERDRMTIIDRQIEAIDKNSVDEPITGRSDGGLSPEARVASLERELATARTMYTDKHPEIQRLEEELASAKKEAVAAQQRPAADRLARLQRNPAYLQLVADREVARNRIRDLERDTADTQASIARYQARVEAAPMVEQQLETIERDYNLEKQQYSELTAKQRAAAINANVERNRSGERFEVIESASFPAAPLKPIPMRVWLGSILGGIIVGAGLTLLREYVDGAVHDERALRDEFELPILGSISHLPA
jgi:polysaccharide chain length determinant protein (PEP-CTERM system associated)